jgi:hypothetical protein
MKDHAHAWIEKDPVVTYLQVSSLPSSGESEVITIDLQ